MAGLSPIFLIWLIAYAIPAFIAGTVVKVLPQDKEKLSTRNVVIMHTALFVSVFISQYFIHSSGLTFPLHLNDLSIAVYILSVLLAGNLLGSTGVWYGFSALAQQLTMLSIAFLLLPVYPIWAVIFLIAPLYTYCHTLRVDNSLLRVGLFLVWGASSILLFSILPNIYIIAALHTLFGSVLISKSFLYPEA